MSNVEKVDELLEECKGTMESAVVCGFDADGNTVIKSSMSNLPFMHWMLNRSVFELGLFEKQNVATENEKTPGSDVDAEASKK
jgi:hypothetical protein